MAFDSTSTPFLMPVNYTNPTYGTQASVQLLTAGGLFPEYTGTGGTFTITTVGNLAALNALAANGFYVVNAFGFTSVARTLTSGDGSVSITNGNGVSGNPIFDVTPDTTVQQINHVYNSGGSPTSTTSTINWIPGSGVGITIVDVGGNSTNVTLSSNGLDNDASVLLLAAATGHSANLGVLTTGLVKSTVSGSVSTPSIAVAGTDYLLPTTTLTQIGALSEVDGALITGAGGVWSILNPGTSGQVLRSTGSGIGWTSVGAGTVTSVAVSSTGSTLTVTGSPITTTGTINADISATYPGQASIVTLGTIATGVWNATNIALNKGGTNAALTASNGGIFYSTASAGAILSGTATASQILMSGASGAPSWSTATYPITIATGTILYGSATNIISALPAGTAGQILTMSGGEPAWTTDTGTGSVTSVAATSSDLTIGGSPITTTGTLTFALNTVAINKGGTGQTSATAAFNALSPLTTTGDIIYASGSNTAARLAIGTSNQVLTVIGGVPAWTSGGEVDVSSVAGTANQIAASSATGDVVLSLIGPYTPATYTAHGVLLGEGTSSIVAIAPSATVGLALVSAGASADPAYGTVVVAGGGTGVTSVTTAPTASAFAGWDANANLSADSFIAGYATTVTAAGTTTLTVTSVQQQYFTGSTTQTVVLPVTSTMVLGQSFTLVNNSSGAVTVNSSGANLVQTLAANSSAIVTVILTSGTTAASWSVNYSSSVDAGGTVTSVAATVPAFLSVAGSPITTSGTLALSYSGTALPIANGGTAVTSVTTAPTASSFAGWDSNANMSADSFIAGYATTATAAGSTTLTVNSVQQQYFTGSTTQTVVLPVTSTMVVGQSFTIVNNSSGAVTVNASDTSLVQTMSANSSLVVTVISTGVTSNAAWSKNYSSSVDAGGTVTSVALSSTSTTLTIGGSPITSSGTLTANLTGGTYDGTNHNVNWGNAVTYSGGVQNTSLGFAVMSATVTGSSNTGIGYAALNAITSGSSNTAVGIGAGQSISSGSNNCVFGQNAGENLTTTNNSNAFGFQALQYPTIANNNAFGTNALMGVNGSSTGQFNNAFGNSALAGTTSGGANTAMGESALTTNTTGSANTAIGYSTCRFTTTGSGNICLGYFTGQGFTNGNESYNILIGAGNQGIVGDSHTTRIGFANGAGSEPTTKCFIDGINGVTTGVATLLPALCDSNGQLGTISSLRELKENIIDMGDKSSAVMNLRPVNFTYKAHAGQDYLQYGLIAEEVEETYPDLAAYDAEGKLNSVRYHDLPVILLNEIQKQKKTIDMLMARLEALEAKAA